MKLILASGSPRRRELLEKMGLTFAVCPSNQEEILQPGFTPQQEVVSLSEQKAQAVYKLAPENGVVLSADTVVVLDDKILGKPVDTEDARIMLRALSGRSHKVLTGVTVMGPKGMESHCEETVVRFKKLSEKEIDCYVATGEPMDKAGGYGIQGLAAMFVTGIEGDYYNVVGLPLCSTMEMLRRVGISVLEDVQ